MTSDKMPEVEDESFNPDYHTKLTDLERLALEDKLYREAKNKIAQLSCSIIENPEENLGKMKELRQIIVDRYFALVKKIRGLVLISLCEIYRDILPGYRIRLITETEKKQQMTKETVKLRRYEEALLVSYKKYLDILSMVLKTYRNENPSKLDAFAKLYWHKTDQQIALRCACSMYTAHPTFNHSDELVAMLVPFLNSKVDEVSSLVNNTFEQSIMEDKHGEVSLRVVRQIHQFIKARNYDVRPQLIRVFLVLNIARIHEDEQGKSLTHKEKQKQWSRKERKHDKVTAKFKKDMQEMNAGTTRETRLKLNTTILKEIFHIYFKILKTKQTSKILSAVLEGLSKFAHLIDLKFFDDLFQVLSEIVEKEVVPLLDSLHCINTAVIVMNRQGAAMDIDPVRFYNHLYRILPRSTTFSDHEVDLVIQCLDALLVARKRQVSQNRVNAFVKRLTSATLHQSPENAAVLLAAVLRYVRLFPKCEILFDLEAEIGGPYIPDLDDPELCNPSSSALWELDLLTRHSSSIVSRLANQVSRVFTSSSHPIGLIGSDDPTRMTPEEIRTMVVSGEESSISTAKPRRQNVSQKRLNVSSLSNWCFSEAKRLKLDLGTINNTGSSDAI